MNENWIKILDTMNEDEILEYLKEEFEQSNIKYKIELEESWEGSIRNPKYKGKFVVYIQGVFESQAEKILNKYYQNNETIIKNLDEIQESDEIEEDETEIESRRIAKRQKNAIKIYVTIILFMIISIIVAAILA